VASPGGAPRVTPSRFSFCGWKEYWRKEVGRQRGWKWRRDDRRKGHRYSLFSEKGWHHKLAHRVTPTLVTLLDNMLAFVFPRTQVNQWLFCIQTFIAWSFHCVSKKLIRRWDSERELSLRRHRKRTTRYNRLVHKFRQRSTRLCVGTQVYQSQWNNAMQRPLGLRLSRSFKVTDFGTDRKLIRLPISD